MVFGLCLDRLDFNLWTISKFTFSRRADLFFWGISLSGMPLYSCFMLNSLNIKIVLLEASKSTKLVTALRRETNPRNICNTCSHCLLYLHMPLQSRLYVRANEQYTKVKTYLHHFSKDKSKKYLQDRFNGKRAQEKMICSGSAEEA